MTNTIHSTELNFSTGATYTGSLHNKGSVLHFPTKVQSFSPLLPSKTATKEEDYVYSLTVR